MKQPLDSTQSTTQQMALAIGLSDRACADNFFAGDNTELLVALQQCVNAEEYKFMYFYGGTSVGKSHLLLAINLLAKEQGKESVYVSFKNRYVVEAMLAELNPSSLICLDDIHAWAGDSAKENALFTLFEQVKHAGGQLIVSLAQPASEAGFNLRDLVSRLSSGLVYPLHGLTAEQQADAVKMRANYRGLSISKETIKFLLIRLPRDTAKLFDVLDTIDKTALIEKRRITIPFLKAILTDA